MNLPGKLGFIGGGKMGEALIKGAIMANIIKADQIAVMDTDTDRRDYLAETYRISCYSAIGPIWSECNVIILAVKPQVVDKVLTASKKTATAGHLLISIAAGVKLATLEKILTDQQCRIIRVMPNTPALVLEAASALSRGTLATADDMATAAAIFDAIGKTVVLDECYLDAVTGLSGSGPAYVFSFIEALIDAGLKVGLDRSVAETLALQTILGSVKLAMHTKDHPAQLRAMVTSPGGTTIAGLHELEAAGFEGIIMDAVEAATQRSIELGK